MPGLLANLEEAAVGQTKFGELARYHRNGQAPLRFNTRARDLLQRVNAKLVALVRDICETRGVQVPAFPAIGKGTALTSRWLAQNVDGVTIHPASLAAWLAANVSAIASDECADQIYHAVERISADVVRMIDRPEPRLFCGSCTNLLHGDHDGHCAKTHPHMCGSPLLAIVGAVEVRCPACRVTYDVDELRQALLNDLTRDERAYTRTELADVLDLFHIRLSQRTFQDWLAKGKLGPTSYKRPDGAFDTWRSPGAKPAYKLGDVLQLHNARRQKATTGARARKAS